PAAPPPGFAGPREGLLAVNPLAPADRLAPLDVSALNARVEAYRMSEPRDLRGPVMLAALALLALDALVVFWLAGGIARLMGRQRRPAAAALPVAGLGGLLALGAPQAFAPGEGPSPFVAAQFVQRPTAAPHPGGHPAPPAPAKEGAQGDEAAMQGTLQTRFAYVLSGDAEVDRISKAGLQGLTLFLAQRTALEAGDPVGVDPASDELAFYPLIYWPVVPSAPRPWSEALDHIAAYMKKGGTVLFDPRDAIEAPPGPDGANRSPGMVALRNILSGLDIPDLEPVPKDHVLTKTFYLLKDFPGRFSTGQLWVEATPSEDEEEQANRPARAGDGVSSIIITSNDLVGAWAI